MRDVKATLGELESLGIAMTTFAVATQADDAVEGDRRYELVEEGVWVCVADLRPLVEELREAEKTRMYLVWVRRLGALR